MNFLDIWKKIEKKNQVIWIKGKIKKNHTSGQENQCPGKKSEREVCLLFWLNLFYNWYLFYTNLSSDISFEK